MPAISTCESQSDAVARLGANRSQLRVMVVSGEVSSDQHAAAVTAEILTRHPAAKIFGMGGSQLRAAGAETVIDSETVGSVMGLTEVIGHLRVLFRAWAQLVQLAEQRRPDVVVLLDFPDFNLRLARALKRRGFRVLYYIAPQIWAWRQGRVTAIRKYVDQVAAIFPFERDFYQNHNVPVEYVGHPFLDHREPLLNRETFLGSLGLDPSLPVIGLLPGSRKAEIEKLLATYVEAFKQLKVRYPEVQGIIPVAPGLSRDLVAKAVGDTKSLAVVSGKAREVLSVSKVSVVTSGTATMEATLSNNPFIVAYSMSPLTYRIAKLLVRGVKYLAMPNVIAEKKIVEELLQHDVTAERLVRELDMLLSDENRYNRCRQDLLEVTAALRLSDGTSSSRVVNLIEKLAERGR